MTETPASKASAAATTTLLLSIVALGAIIYLATEVAEPKPLFFMLAGLALAVTLVLHFIFVWLLARREGKNARTYLAGAVLTYPLGSAIGLILYEWRVRVDQESSNSAA